MGGTTLVTKGILGPIEGDVSYHETILPLIVDAQVVEMSIVLPTEVIVETSLPDAVTAEIEIAELELEVSIPLLDVTAELED